MLFIINKKQNSYNIYIYIFNIQYYWSVKYLYFAGYLFTMLYMQIYSTWVDTYYRKIDKHEKI